ncbi:MAG: substrate-binding domain-containing protein [Rhodobacteraceae bacterium]|nr:substrate-binding domain-containing protein [Paracoccaceae bacterium]
MSRLSRISALGLRVIAGLLFTLTFAQAQEVTVQSLDGSVSMSGELLSYDGNFYILKTRMGEVSINANGVICTGLLCPVTDTTTRIRFAGSNTLGLVLMPNLLEEFGAVNDLSFTETVAFSTSNSATPNHAEFVIEDKAGEVFAELTIDSNGSDTAFGGLLNGTAEIVMSSRQIRREEVLAFIAVGLGDMSLSDSQTVVALDGVTIIVARQNSVISLTIDQIAAVFSGEITNWAELGGDDQPITVFRRDDTAGTTSDFFTSVMAPHSVGFLNSAQIANSDKELSANVANTPGGIGFVGFAFENNARALALRDTCGFPVRPTEFNIKTGEYPLARRLYLYTVSRQFSPEAKLRGEKITEFLEFVRSGAAQRVVSDSGFVSQGIIDLPMEMQGQRLASTFTGDRGDLSNRDIRRFVNDLREATRLSSTFRFRDGNPVLDAQSTQDIARLAVFLSAPENAGKEVVFAGFTDSIGAAPENAQLSDQRAARAMQLVRAVMGRESNGLSFSAVGYGEVSPLACNDTVYGRAVNRRVEVWMRDPD